MKSSFTQTLEIQNYAILVNYAMIILIISICLIEMCNHSYVE